MRMTARIRKGTGEEGFQSELHRRAAENAADWWDPGRKECV